MTLSDVSTEELDRHRGVAEAASERVAIPLAQRVWKGQAGDFHGSGVGSSLDFQDHRTYIPGDDPRHINWQAYARSGVYTMKLYREEVRPIVDVLWDVSASMFFDPGKARRSLELFYLSLFAVLKSGASGRFHLVSPRGDESLPIEAFLDHTWISHVPVPPKNAPSSEPPDLGGVPLRPQAMRLLISDLLFDGDADPILRRLGDHRGFGLILSPYCQLEAQPDWEGNYEFVDSESQTRHAHRVQASVLKRYRQAYAAHFAHWKQLGRKYDISIARVPAEPPLEEALASEALAEGALTLTR